MDRREHRTPAWPPRRSASCSPVGAHHCRGDVMHDVDQGVRAAIDGEIALLDPAVRASRDRTEGLLDDDFVEFGSSGRVWDRESALAAMAGDLSAAEAPISAADLCGVRLSETIVHVTYVTKWRGAASRRSSLWRRTDGCWRLYFHQGTPFFDT
jgi:hypothetical protein